MVSRFYSMQDWSIKDLTGITACLPVMLFTSCWVLITRKLAQVSPVRLLFLQVHKSAIRNVIIILFPMPYVYTRIQYPTWQPVYRGYMQSSIYHKNIYDFCLQYIRMLLKLEKCRNYITSHFVIRIFKYTSLPANFWLRLEATNALRKHIHLHLHVLLHAAPCEY